ncbi:MAG: ABC transporter ATP-binding protein [bacterium]
MVKADTPLLDVRDLVKLFKMGEYEVRALDGTSFEIWEGEMVAIVGPSGSGKSTMMNILGCLDRPTSGSYRLNEREVSNLGANALARVRNKEIGFVFQSFNLLPRTTALENVELPLIYAGTPKRRQRAKEALERVGLGDRAHHKPNELSGGQQQRVAIARAIVNNPAIILADEPTGNLDTKNSYEIMELFQELNEAGRTIIIVTHEADIAHMCKRTLHFQDGKLREDERNPSQINAAAALKAWKLERERADAERLAAASR